jgi:hypothetical protein
LSHELGITTTSFAPIGAVVKGGVAGVPTWVVPIVEEKTACKLLLVFFFFSALVL